MNNIQLVIQPERDALLAGHANRFHVLVRAQVGEQPANSEPSVPLNLALVVDRSGSMGGEPIEEAKKCAIDIVKQLRPVDHVAVVAFDDQVKLVLAAQKVANTVSLVSSIAGIRAGGNTDLHAGWLAGAEQLASVHREGTFSRVMILSDGCANHGETDLSRIADQCRKMAGVGITTSTYGLGRGFKEEFLKTMADAGNGNAYYGATAQDLADNYNEEFSLLKHSTAKNVQLRITAENGVDVVLKNPYTELSRHVWRLPNLAWASEVWALLEVTVADSHVTTSTTDRIALLNVELSYELLDGSGLEAAASGLSLAPVSAPVFEAIAPDETVTMRVRELRVAGLASEARHHARRGDWERVEEIIEIVRREAGNHEWLHETAAALLELAKERNTESFSKEAFFKAQNLSTRHALADEKLDYSIDEEFDKAAFLRRKREKGRKLEGNP